MNYDPQTFRLRRPLTAADWSVRFATHRALFLRRFAAGLWGASKMPSAWQDPDFAQEWLQLRDWDFYSMPWGEYRMAESFEGAIVVHLPSSFRHALARWCTEAACALLATRWARFEAGLLLPALPGLEGGCMGEVWTPWADGTLKFSPWDALGNHPADNPSEPQGARWSLLQRRARQWILQADRLGWNTELRALLRAFAQADAALGCEHSGATAEPPPAISAQRNAALRLSRAAFELAPCAARALLCAYAMAERGATTASLRWLTERAQAERNPQLLACVHLARVWIHGQCHDWASAWRVGRLARAADPYSLAAHLLPLLALVRASRPGCEREAREIAQSLQALTWSGDPLWQQWLLVGSRGAEPVPGPWPAWVSDLPSYASRWIHACFESPCADLEGNLRPQGQRP